MISCRESARPSSFEAMMAFMDALQTQKDSFKKDLICELKVLEQEVKALNTRSWFPIKTTPQKTPFELPVVVLDGVFTFASIQDWKNWQWVDKTWHNSANSPGTLKCLARRHFSNSSLTLLDPSLVKDWSFTFRFLIALNNMKQDVKIVQRHQRHIQRAFLTSILVSTTIFIPPLLEKTGSLLHRLGEIIEENHRRRILEYMRYHPELTYEEAASELIRIAYEEFGSTSWY